MFGIDSQRLLDRDALVTGDDGLDLRHWCVPPPLHVCVCEQSGEKLRLGTVARTVEYACRLARRALARARRRVFARPDRHDRRHRFLGRTIVRPLSALRPFTARDTCANRESDLCSPKLLEQHSATDWSP